MKKLFNKINISSLNYYVFLILVFTIPLNDRILIFSINLWLLTYIIDVILNKRRFNFTISKENIIFIFLILLFLIEIFSLFYTSNISYAKKLLERRISFLIFPLAVVIGFNNHYNFEKVIKVFIAGTLFSALIIILNSFQDVYINKDYRGLFTNDTLEFFQQEIDKIKHRGYWGFCGLISIVFIYYHYREHKLNRNQKLLLILSGSLFSLLIIISEARAITGCLFLTVIVIFYNEIINKKKHLSFIIGTIIFVIVIFFIVKYIPRYASFLKNKTFSLEQIKQSEPRVLLWENALQVAKKNWLYGVGVGDVQDVLNNSFIRSNKENQGDYNTHNQYLQILIENGIIALLILMCILSLQLYSTTLNKRKYLWLILIFFWINFLFENYLNRITGIVLFTILPVIFSIKDNYKSRSDIEKKKLSFNWIYYLSIFIQLNFILVIIIFGVLVRPVSDPKDPETFVTPPFEILEHNLVPVDLPDGTKGFKLNDQYFNLNFNKIGYYYMTINSLRVSSGDSIEASIYYHFNKSFKNGVVCLIIGSNILGYKTRYLNEKSVGVWEKATVSGSFAKGKVKMIILFNQLDLNPIQGEIMFAYPHFNVLLKKN